MKQITLVSVIICTKNKDTELNLCLQSILDQEVKHANIEIVVVDAMSNDNTPKVLYNFRNYIKVVYDDGNSLTKARNIGLMQSTGEIVIHFDADYIMDSYFIIKTLKHFDAGDIDALIMSHGVLKNMDFWNEIQSWERIIRKIYMNFLEPSNILRYGYPRIFHRKILKKIYYHNEEIDFYGEDAQLSWALTRISARIKYVPDVIFYKIEENNLKEIWKKAYQYGIGRNYKKLAHYNSRYMLNIIGPFFNMFVPFIPFIVSIIGLSYSRSFKISISLFLLSWLRMSAQSLGALRRIFGL